VFTFETIEPESAYHARNFAPVYGINEDPVTGTANGAVSNYLKKHHLINDKKIICEQGDIIGRPGRVIVEIDENTVRVGGCATIVEERTMTV
jgi:PhzF family phenazine biosynthesis protein